MDAITVTELTEAQGRELFDRRCREELGISGDEFLARYDRGDVECWQWPADELLILLLILLPFAGEGLLTRTEAGHATTRSPRSPRWDLAGRYRVAVGGRLMLDRFRLVQTPWFAVLLTRILAPDPGRDPHDHSRPFASLIVRGGYTERIWLSPGVPGPVITRARRRWSVHMMRLRWAHSVVSVEPGTVTLVLAGRHRGTWSFWTADGPVDYREYG